MRSASTRCPSSSRVSRLTPIRPSSASGWRTVVRDGVTIAAWNGVVEADDREVLRNATGRARRATLSAPIATLSLKPKIAVGGSGSEERCSAASSPRGMRQSEQTISSGVGQDAARRPARRGSRSSRSSVAYQPGWPPITPIRRWPSSSRCSVASFAPAACIAETHGMPVGGGSRGSTTTNGKPVSLEMAQLVGRLLRQHQDRAVGGAAHQPLEQRDLAVVLVHASGRA